MKALPRKPRKTARKGGHKPGAKISKHKGGGRAGGQTIKDSKDH